MANKVAQISIFFWILKILATTLGETSGDMLAMTMDMGYMASLAITGVILLVFLFFQIRSENFTPCYSGSVLLEQPQLGRKFLILWIAR